MAKCTNKWPSMTYEVNFVIVTLPCRKVVSNYSAVDRARCCVASQLSAKARCKVINLELFDMTQHVAHQKGARSVLCTSHQRFKSCTYGPPSSPGSNAAITEHAFSDV